MDFLKKIDLYKEIVTFGIRRDRKYNSVIGGLLWIIIFIIMFLLFIYFAWDCFNRLNPLIIQENIDFPESRKYYLNKDNFILDFNIQILDKNGVPVTNNTLKYLDIVGKIYDYNRKVTSMKFNINNGKINYLVDSQILSDIDPQYYLGNMKITFGLCTVCNITEAQNILSDTNIDLKIITNKFTVVPSNYSNPTSLQMTVISSTLNKDMTKSINLYYKNISLTRDLGWLFTNFEKFTGIDLDKQELDILKIGENMGFKNNLLTITVFFSRSEQRVNAYYLKIQAILAQVGGLINIISYFFSFLISFYYENKISNYMVNSVFQLSNVKNNIKLNVINFRRNLESPKKGKYYSECIPNNKNISINSPNSNDINLKKNDKFEVLNSELCDIYDFSLYDQYFTFFKFCITKERRVNNYLFLKCLENVRDNLDVANYLRLLNDFDDLLKFLLTPNQYIYFKFPRKKVAIKKLEDIQKLNENIDIQMKKIEKVHFNQESKLLNILGINLID